MNTTEIRLIGTSHIAKKSVDRIKSEFLSFQPDFVAVELDNQRLGALLTGAKPSMSPAMIKHIGVVGYLFALIGGLIQRKLGKLVQMDPGADMLQAALLARNNHLPLLLMDQDIRITLQQLSKRLTWKEKVRLVHDLLFGWRQKQKVTIALDDVPSNTLIEHMITQLKNRYPTFYEVLIKERNEFMAQRLAAAAASNAGKKFLVVMGAGHEEGFRKDFEKAMKKLQSHDEKKIIAKV